MTGMDMDILSEVYAITMGASAMVLTSLLHKKSDSGTTKTEVVKCSDFVFTPDVSAWGIELKYTSGFSGTNVLVMKQSDIVKIVNGLFGNNTLDEPTELTDLHFSAITEIVKQMMGAATLSLNKLLEMDIAISVTQPFKINGDYRCLIDGTLNDDTIVANRLKFTVEGLIDDSEMVIVSSVPFAKEMLSKAKKSFGLSKE